MDEQNEKSTRIATELEIENMQEFLLENQDIKLENLPRYEDLIKPETQTETKPSNMQEVNNLPFFEPKVKQNQETPTKSKHQQRFKIVVSCFAVIGVLFMALTLINGVSLTLLANKKKDNQKEIATLTEEVNDIQQNLEMDNVDDAQKVPYALALPRNYPEDTSELTWFDKLSIFLMKLFG